MRLLLLVTIPALAACAERDYPSLAPRPAEQGTFAEPDIANAEPAADDPSLDADIARADAALAQIAREFDAARARAVRRATAARGSAAGSDAWLDAHTALGELDAVRSRQVEVLSELEALAGRRGGTLAAPYAALDTSIAAAQRGIDATAQAIAEIGETLPPG